MIRSFKKMGLSVFESFVVSLMPWHDTKIYVTFSRFWSRSNLRPAHKRGGNTFLAKVSMPDWETNFLSKVSMPDWESNFFGKSVHARLRNRFFWQKCSCHIEKPIFLAKMFMPVWETDFLGMLFMALLGYLHSLTYQRGAVQPGTQELDQSYF
jgi:hypothetical protein